MAAELLAADFVLQEPESRVEELIEKLTAGTIAPGASRPRVAQAVQLGGDSLERTMRLLGAWGAERDGGAHLARALESQLVVKRATQAAGVRAELVWTGRKPPGSSLRNTPQVVSEMLSQAEHHVVVLAYTLWFGQLDAGAVLDQLAGARSSGVTVTFVVDRRYSANGIAEHNLVQLKNQWPAATPRPQVYSWGDEDDAIAKLHAKMVVVDRRDLLVTSANLTGHGMTGNLELGVRLMGQDAARAHDHVMDLITSHVFRKEELW